VIVPETSTGFKLEQILFFTDFKDGDVHTLEAFKDIVAGAERPVTLVHIVDEASGEEKTEGQQLHAWKEKLHQETGYSALQSELVRADENLHIINHIIQRLNADLTLLTLTREKGFFDKLFYKSLAKAIVLNPRIPVLLTSARK